MMPCYLHHSPAKGGLGFVFLICCMDKFVDDMYSWDLC